MPDRIPEEHARAAGRWLEEFCEVIGSVGRHEGHSLTKVGRCVACSCGFRYQGSMPTARDVAECRAAYAKGQEAVGDG